MVKKYFVLKHQLRDEKELKELCEGEFKKEDGTPLIIHKKDDILFEVLKKSDVKEAIEKFEMTKLITAGGIETGYYIDKEDWNKLKKELGIDG